MWSKTLKKLLQDGLLAVSALGLFIWSALGLPPFDVAFKDLYRNFPISALLLLGVWTGIRCLMRWRDYKKTKDGDSLYWAVLLFFLSFLCIAFAVTKFA
jgi:hypothetical protein